MFGYCFNKLILQSPIYKFRKLLLILLVYILIFLLSTKDNIYPINEILGITSLLGTSGILATLFVIGVSYNISKKFNNALFIKMLTYWGIYSILVYVFHMPTFTIFNKITVSINLGPNFTKLLILFLSGIFFPLVYGKLLSNNKLIYRLLLGRDP